MQVQEGKLRGLDTRISDPAPEGNLLVLVAGDVGEVCARSARGLEVLGSTQWELAISVSRNVGSVGGLLLRAIRQLAGFGCSLLLCLGGSAVPMAAAGGCACLFLLLLRLLQRVLRRLLGLRSVARARRGRCGVAHGGQVAEGSWCNPGRVVLCRLEEPLLCVWTDRTYNSIVGRDDESQSGPRHHIPAASSPSQLERP